MDPNNEWDHFRLNQAEALITAAVPDVLRQLEQIEKA